MTRRSKPIMGERKIDNILMKYHIITSRIYKKQMTLRIWDRYFFISELLDINVFVASYAFMERMPS